MLVGEAESTCCVAPESKSGPTNPNPPCCPNGPLLSWSWSLWPSTGSVTSTSQEAGTPLQRSQKQLGYREWERHMSLTRLSWYKPHDEEARAMAAAALSPTEETPRQSEEDGPDDKAQHELLKKPTVRNVGSEDAGEKEESAEQGGEDGVGALAALNLNPRPESQHGSADTANRQDDGENVRVEQSHNRGPENQQMKEESKDDVKKEDDDSEADAGVQQQNTQAQESTPSKHHFTVEHVKELESIFEQTPYPCSLLRNDLARIMNVTEGRINIWFRHRRSKLKRLRIMPYNRSQNNPITGNLRRNFRRNFRNTKKPDQTQLSPNQDPGPSQVPMAPMPSQGPRPNQAPVAPVLSQELVVPMPSQGPMANQAPVALVPSQEPVVPVLNAVPMLILMPSQVPVVPHSFVPLMMPLVPMLSPAYPPGLLPPYPVLPVAVPVFPGFVPAMQPVLPNIPVYPQPMPPRRLPPIVPTWSVTVSGPLPLLY